MKIAIIGAGPIGCYAAYLLAESGHQVSVYEKKMQIGRPIQCTGLLTSDFDQFNLPMDSFLINTFDKLEVNSPNKQKVEVKQREYLVCREKFDNYMANLAKTAGVEIHLGHSFVRKEGYKIVVKSTEGEIKLNPDKTIAADGPLSPTAKAFGFADKKHYYGIQAVVEGIFNPSSYQTFFGKEVCPDLFAWIVPESSNKARIGLATRKNSKEYFDKFVEEKIKDDFKIVEMQAGIIPIYNPKQKLKQSNCYFLGDAAGFVKATTLGGIIPGFKQAEILVDCLNNNKDYQEEIKPLIRKLKLHLSLRKALNKFSDQDWNKLISYVDQEKVQKVLEKYTRDNPLPLAANILLREPRFLRFGKYLF